MTAPHQQLPSHTNWLHMFDTSSVFQNESISYFTNTNVNTFTNEKCVGRRDNSIKTSSGTEISPIPIKFLFSNLFGVMKTVLWIGCNTELNKQGCSMFWKSLITRRTNRDSSLRHSLRLNWSSLLFLQYVVCQCLLAICPTIKLLECYTEIYV